MRTDKELLQVLLDNIDKLEYGLCGLATTLWLNYIISYKELEVIRNIIESNKPKNALFFYFPIGQKQPRIEYLQKLIDAL
jgi:hypothetical protein